MSLAPRVCDLILAEFVLSPNEQMLSIVYYNIILLLLHQTKMYQHCIVLNPKTKEKTTKPHLANLCRSYTSVQGFINVAVSVIFFLDITWMTLMF